MPGVLILSAAIGGGHDVPAERLAGDLRTRGVDAFVADGVTAMGGAVERTIMGSTSYESRVGNAMFDVGHFLGLRVAPTRRLAGRLLQTFGARGLLALIAERRPDVIVSTYPGTTELLGRLRRSGRLATPAVAVITDLASLRFWAHPSVDLHLVTHPESAPEVHRISGAAADVVAVRGFNPAGFEAPPSRVSARAALHLPASGSVVTVSGGGWGVGDVVGAVAAARAAGAGRVLALCGTNAALQDRLSTIPDVRPLGFTDRMPEVLAASDVLIHSTAGLTVLEGLICGARVISYGWARGHIRANNKAFGSSGLAEVVRTPAELRLAIERALRSPGAPLASWFALPAATDVLIDRFPQLAG